MNTAAPSNVPDITVTQLYDRAALAHLIEVQDTFDTDTRNKLRSIKANRTKGSLQGSHEVVYKLARSKAGQLGYGRLYGQKHSLENLQSECRGTLCAKLYHDLDIVNAQPTLLLQLAHNEYQMDLTVLEEYCLNRDAWLTKIDANREIAKEKTIAVLYGAKATTPDLVRLHDEIQRFARVIVKTGRHADLWEAMQSENNKYGSFMAHIGQTCERKCMLVMKEAAEAAGWSVDVLAYDGIQVRRRDNIPISEELLTEMKANVFARTGFKIDIKEKQFNPFPVPDAAVQDDSAYEVMKQRWEENHFYFKPSGTIVEITQDGMTHYGIEHATEAFNGWILPGEDEGKPRMFLKKWRADANRRIVTNLVYKLPEDCEAHEASLFQGFAYKNITADPMDEAVALFMDILSCCCKDEAPVVEYVLKTFAHMIQRPFDITGVCVIFSSRLQGTGKDTLMGIIRRIIGTGHTAHYTSDSAFWSEYDTKKEGAIMMYLEEAGSAANKAKFGELKAKITGDSTLINPKGVKAYSVKNIARYFMTTNEPDPVKCEDGDRRFLLINPSNRLMTADWVDIYSKIHQPSFLRAIGEYLETVDISGWNPRKFPVTETKREIQQLSKGSEQLFLEQWKSDGEGLLGRDLYLQYRSFCQEECHPRPQSQRSFLKKILPFKNGLFITKEGRSRIVTYHSIAPPDEPIQPVAGGGGGGGDAP